MWTLNSDTIVTIEWRTNIWMCQQSDAMKLNNLCIIRKKTPLFLPFYLCTYLFSSLFVTLSLLHFLFCPFENAFLFSIKGRPAKKMTIHVYIHRYLTFNFVFVFWGLQNRCCGWQNFVENQSRIKSFWGTYLRVCSSKMLAHEMAWIIFHTRVHTYIHAYRANIW
jgi:hypothetical protein